MESKPRADGEWSTDFCHCSSDCSLCCITYWCPCVTFGQIAEIVDQGSTSCGTAGAMYVLISTFAGCACIYSCSYRSKMRRQYNLKGSDCGDCLKHCFCENRALTQMYRELKIRGFDVPLGWQGNVERQNAGVVMGAPVVSGGMMR
ncbi:Protein PLANT CADMIUM RESISTANCE 2 [Cardamine amara subsp. amara]|uniref:Protein PLANT CADMIUM RESISTANCE 2 n=1 Tax=Cardamine amara subsp. amara TaxID=228776 RepID=A0ABD1AXN6_CARAN